MTTGYSTLTRRDVIREIKTIRETAKKISGSRKTTRDFLIKAGILAKNGRELASRYR